MFVIVVLRTAISFLELFRSLFTRVQNVNSKTTLLRFPTYTIGIIIYRRACTQLLSIDGSAKKLNVSSVWNLSAVGISYDDIIIFRRQKRRASARVRVKKEKNGQNETKKTKQNLSLHVQRPPRAGTVIRFTLRTVGVYHFYCRHIFPAAYDALRPGSSAGVQRAWQQRVYTTGGTPEHAA